MTKQTNTQAKKAMPSYRICFSAKNGTDQEGQPQLAYPVEIGAAFARKDPAKGLVAKFTFLPSDLKDGVLFLMPVREEVGR